MAADLAEGAAHILVVDDDERLRSLLRKFLSRQGFFVSVARDAAHARRLMDGLEFDLLVIDVMMPGENGFDLTKSLRQDISTPILLLTARAESDDRITGLEAGADDYLAKPFDPRELLLRCNAILRRVTAPAPKSEPPPKTLHLGQIRYDITRGEMWQDKDMIRLTSTEAALMRIFAASPHEPVTRLRLIEELGRSGEQSQERAIDVQITRLRRKIEADPKAPRYLQTVRGAGYMLAPD
ncbi:two-component system phosphate regulon response regulator OmpR [Rubricella aquisinus]|uniref:Two-component system phosphate regulon response regulator OmpR n=1 Tax=Rubricella aquisinus TaxID=2028108 RepID=A0A840WN98_9RHOB|nr:two-component system phosphate regulon response regulator OmpR [Rubricella aquisinus]